MYIYIYTCTYTLARHYTTIRFELEENDYNIITSLPMLLQQVVVTLLDIRPLLATMGSPIDCEGFPVIMAVAGNHGDAGDLDCWSHDDSEDRGGDAGDFNC